MRIAPIAAVLRVNSNAAADTSSTPIRMRNHTGKCQKRMAWAQPLVSENFAAPWRAKT